MEITQVSTSRAGEKKEIGERLLAISVNGPPNRTFREILYLRFGPVGLAEELIIDHEATSLIGKFSYYDYDAVNIAEPSLRATKIQFGDGVRVTLGSPRKVISIRINPSKIPGLGYILEFFRIDGQALSETPTSTSLSPPLTFLKDNQAQEVGGLFVSPSPERTFNVNPSHAHKVRAMEEHAAPASFFVDFTDAQFVVRLKKLDGPYISIVPSDITEIKIRSYPTGPRIGIAYPLEPIQGNFIDPSEAIFFWQNAGEIETTVPEDLSMVDAGESLATELERGIPRLLERRRELFHGNGPEKEQSFFDIGLVMESDAPCRFNTTKFNISYLYARESWGNGQPKQVLHFNGEQVTTQQISFQLPQGAVVASATLVATESFYGPHAQVENGGAELFQSLRDHDIGNNITNTRWVAQSITHPEMRSISGIALGLLPMNEETHLQIEIQEDFQGQPSGRKLLCEILRVGQPGRRDWSMLWFKKSIILSTQPHWLLLTTLCGQVIWLTQDGTTQICILEKSDHPTIGAKLATFRNTTTLHRFFLSPPNKKLHDLPQVNLSIGGHVVTPIALQKNVHEYDLNNALEAYLVSNAAKLTPMDLPLNFSAMASGTVTVYPPRIEYDVKKEKFGD